VKGVCRKAMEEISGQKKRIQNPGCKKRYRRPKNRTGKNSPQRRPASQERKKKKRNTAIFRQKIRKLRGKKAATMPALKSSGVEDKKRSGGEGAKSREKV